MTDRDFTGRFGDSLSKMERILGEAWDVCRVADVRGMLDRHEREVLKLREFTAKLAVKVRDMDARLVAQDAQLEEMRKQIAGLLGGEHE